MKRWLIICLCVMFMAQGVLAGACVGGTEYVGKNGHSYCISSRGMNWWSAYQWCEAQGRRFATPSEACDYNGEVWSGGRCWNLQGVSLSGAWIWFAMSAGDNHAYVTLGGDWGMYGVGMGTGHKNAQNLAICY